MKKSIFVVSTILAISLLVIQVAPVAAYWCEEGVNPHGNITPGANYPTEEADNSYRPHNPDGFCIIVGPELPPERVEVWYGDEDHPLLWGPYELGLVVKWTQAPGSDHLQMDIGSGDGNGGQADAVTYHFIVPNEPWYTVFVDGEPLSWGPCLVPPPPM